jgi:hypothetical protein
MRIILMILTAALAAAGLIVGSVTVMGGLVGSAEFVGAGSLGDVADTEGFAFVDNSMRFLAALFVIYGLGFAYCLFGVQNKTALFRFLLLGIFAGGLARVFGWYEMGLVEATIAPTAVELIFPPVMYYLQARISAR